MFVSIEIDSESKNTALINLDDGKFPDTYIFERKQIEAALRPWFDEQFKLGIVLGIAVACFTFFVLWITNQIFFC